MNQKFDFWEIYDICASDTGVNIIVQSDDMLNGLCIRLTVKEQSYMPSVLVKWQK